MNKIETKTKARSARVAISKYIPAQLSFWPEKKRAIANELARCALFRAGDNRAPRVQYDNTSLFMLGEGALTYKGEELRTQDEDIFVTLAHGARKLPSGKMVVKITSSQICLQNNWRQDQRYYNHIFLSIQRMKGGIINIYSRRLAKALACERALEEGASDEELARLYDELEAFDRDAFNGKDQGQDTSSSRKDGKDDKLGGMMLSLVSGEPTFTNVKSLKDNIPQGNLHWEITLDSRLVSLFAKPYLTLVDREARLALTNTGKGLQKYFSSHAKPYAVLLRSLEKFLGLSYEDIAALKYFLNEQFKALVEHGVIQSYSFSKSADGTDWLVSVERMPPEAETPSDAETDTQSE